MKCLFKPALFALVAVTLFACSKGNDKASNIDPRTGKHPAGWAVANTGGSHPTAFLSVPSSCYECHGKDLKGGISGVSCFTASRSGMSCHANGPSGHPAGWAAPDVHGAAAKAALSGMNGLARCQVCHGADFSGGIAKKSCLNTAGCHGTGIMAAHSPKPWLSRIGGRTHTSADPSNAAACAVCHTAGANSSRKPSATPPAGTAPNCFNNTLCHGVEGHAFASWTSAGFHGAAAKAAAGGITVNGQYSPVSSFASCVACHGTDYNGGTAQQTCLKTTGCHGANVAAPHPARPWRSTTGGVTHTTTDTSNAGQCAVCHTNGANSTRVPRAGDAVGITGCFNNTLCHGTEGHPAGWSAAAQHGAAAKAAPGATTGFSSCQPCHGTTFNNGAEPSCTNTLGCHGLFVSSPHPAKPWSSTVAGASTHTTTDPGNAAICAACHTAGANSTVVPPNPASGTASCYNNTLCHFHQIPFAPPAVDPSVHGSLAKQNLTVCQTCHGAKGTTSFDGLALAGGVTTIACSSCHTFAKAHPTAWQGSTTNPGETVIYSHRTAGNIANACSLCHDVTQGRTAPLAAAPSCFSTTFTNSLTQTGTCHANGPGVAPHSVPYPNHNATARSNFTYCLGCHQVAANAAGSKPPGCQNCHLTSPTVTSTGCTSCHAKPPAGTSYPNIAGVHASHAVLNVTENTTQTAVCDQCHNGLGLGTLDHLNRARARTSSVQANPVVFGSLAFTGGLAPTYTAATQTCAATYCHGNTLDKPASAILSPSWTTPFLTGSAASDCIKCHGYPPSSHAAGITPAQCINCHPHVNSSGTGFTDATKHINGVIDATGAHTVPYLTHNAVAAASCLATNGGCHSTGTAASPYPAATGVPPDCMSCHTLADPLGTGNGLGNCKSCHGTGGTGTLAAPTGTTWPNIRGTNTNARHPSHQGSSCGYCHPNVDTTGRFTGTIAAGTVAAGSGAGVNHGPNKTMTSGTSQTNVVNTAAGIVPKTPRGTGATCTHGSLAVSGCHSGPGVQTW
ncbi:CxxxxCH/CxxCH domain-containing protein [Oryzomonas japonica]|uniref:CxxxxCH/CxxCH domain-containing protein n=1 Tax=Oryzomonas japonica TaxID=2603858 RepID=A0A7J4ZV04_9BACT|nr:CxxxxCH/CxxCH domain-containing protein [Oryzomonas japonica]KAB0667241.1 CxxxxCH/CxxCH domain-containing protein [Oryzomonas japonica]